MARFRTRVRHRFDRSIIRYNWRSINNGPLKFAGLRVRAAAIRSIKSDRSTRGRERYSAPGQPPRSRAPGKPFKRIYSVPNTYQSRVFIGLPYFSGYSGSTLNPVPGRHEHGGTAVINTFRHTGTPNRRQFTPQQLARIQQWYSRHGRNRPRQRRSATIASRRVRFKPRPFMIPALEKVRHTLPSLWARSIK